MTGKMDTKPRRVRCPKCFSVLSEPSDVLLYACGGCGAKLQVKKRNISTVDTKSQRLDEESSGKQKVDGVFVDQEASSRSIQQSLLKSTDELDQNSDHNDLHISNEDQGATKRNENGTVDAPQSVVEDCSFEKLEMKQLSDDQDVNKQLTVNSNDEHDQNIHNDPRSSTEFSGHEDPESSPEAAAHNIIDQEHEEQNQKQEQIHYQEQKENNSLVGFENLSDKQKTKQLSDDNEISSSLTHLLSVNSMNNLDQSNDYKDHRNSSELSYHENHESSPEATVHNRFIKGNETGNEETSREFEDIANTRIVSDSDGGSKSSFRTMIVKKSPDTRQKKLVYPDEDDLLSEDGSSDLHRRRRFGSAKGYYGYDGSVSSFDGNDDQNPRKNEIRSVLDEYVDSGNRYRFNRRKDAYRSTDVGSSYNLNEFHENPRHHSPMIAENPKLERLELLKLVRELQDQLERTNVSNLQEVPPYYDHVYPRRYNRRMAFSSDRTVMNRRLDRYTCRHFSSQLPGHHVCCNGSDYQPNTYYSPRFSGQSSPIPNRSESDYSLTDDQWRLNRVTKPVHSSKKKRYVRPIAGGSPWITCYLCSKVLQLPQSFLLSNKRYHSLRCGCCLKVLNFRVSNGTHVSRYYPEETIVAHSSSEVEEFGKVSGLWVGPVSCSDRSFEKSYSSETDRNGSREFGEDRKKATVSRDPSGSTRPSSSKISGRRTTTSEIEVEPGHNGSALHWLMGYASPSKVIRG